MVVEISEQLTLYTMETISIIMILDVDLAQVAKDQGAKRAVFDQNLEVDSTENLNLILILISILIFINLKDITL